MLNGDYFKGLIFKINISQINYFDKKHRFFWIKFMQDTWKMRSLWVYDKIPIVQKVLFFVSPQTLKGAKKRTFWKSPSGDLGVKREFCRTPPKYLFLKIRIESKKAFKFILLFYYISFQPIPDKHPSFLLIKTTY